MLFRSPIIYSVSYSSPITQPSRINPADSLNKQRILGDQFSISNCNPPRQDVGDRLHSFSRPDFAFPFPELSSWTRTFSYSNVRVAEPPPHSCSHSWYSSFDTHITSRANSCRIQLPLRLHSSFYELRFIVTSLFCYAQLS